MSSHPQKYALIVAINYTDISGINTLYQGSTVNAQSMYDVLTQHLGYLPQNIRILCDCEPSGLNISTDTQVHLPTSNAIYTELTAIMIQSKSASEITIYYSGHGTHYNTPNWIDTILDIESAAGMVPIDSATKGTIADTNLMGILQLASCPTLILTDCCYSGSIFELPNSQKVGADGEMEYFQSGHAVFWNPNIVMLSSTRNNEEGVFFYDPKIKGFHGVFTNAFTESLQQFQYDVDIVTLFKNIHTIVVSSGFQQRPVLSSSRPHPIWKIGTNPLYLVENNTPTPNCDGCNNDKCCCIS